MYRHVVIATDGSELAGKAVTQGLALAKTLGAKVTIVTVTDPMPALVSGDATPVLSLQDYARAAAAHAAKILDGAAAAAKASGVACETVHVKEQYPAQGIVDTAKAGGGDLIVMASHGRRGLSKLLLGSQATEVVSLSPVPVLVCR
jgi:nucleotide-binding universal stress UspA family protein